MALTYPGYNTLSEQARAELRRRKPGVDPTVFGSFARPFLDSAAALAYGNTLLVRDLERQLFPQTADGEFLELWGDYEGLARNPASGASGSISLPGTIGTVIPALTEFTAANGVTYQSTAATSIQSIGQAISSLTRSGSVVTATTSAPHSLATGLDATIAGAVEPEYNGTFEIVVTGESTFTYSINTTPTTPATGTIGVTGEYAVVAVSATTTGAATNLSAASVLSLAAPITGADNSGFVQFGGISGGAETETDEAYRARIILSRSTIEGVFTPDQIELAALSVPGNTRAFIVKPSISVADPAPSPGFVPVPGQVAVYILRDNDDNIIPPQSILNTTKQRIIDDGSLPANTAEADLYVFAPIPVDIAFDFSAISPDTPTMRTAIRNSLAAFFRDSVTFEADITEATYLGAIQNTQDLNTGQFLQSFSLSSPSGTINVNDGEIAVLGAVTFP